MGFLPINESGDKVFKGVSFQKTSVERRKLPFFGDARIDDLFLRAKDVRDFLDKGIEDGFDSLTIDREYSPQMGSEVNFITIHKTSEYEVVRL